MASANFTRFLQRLTRGMSAETLGERTDRQLVASLLRGRDEAAFETLVRRHGGMVYRVCARILQHGPDAEDAMQATFLLLARKLATVRKHQSLASWLHGVARRAALKVRAQAATRRRHERQATCAQRVPADTLSWMELRTILDTELAGLPDKWRLPLILCYLEGKTQDEAAGQVGWSKSTMRRRLGKARAALRRRLARRGITGPAALGGLLLADCIASASLPSRLTATADACIRVVTGLSVAGIVSTNVITLTDGMRKAMFLGKLKVIALVMVAALLGFCGIYQALDAGASTGAPCVHAGAVATAPSQGAGPAAPQQDGAVAMARGKILVWHDTRFEIRTPDGKERGDLPAHPDRLIMNRPVLSPDGKRVAFTVNGNPPTDEKGNLVNRHAFVRALDGKDADFKIEINAVNVAWTADGKKLLVVELVPAQDPRDGGFSTWLVDAATREKTALDLPRWVHPFELTADGKALVAAVYDFEARKIHLAVVSRAGKNITKLTELRNEGAEPRLAPDGASILYQDYDPAEKVEKGQPPLLRLFVYDLKARERRRLAGTPDNGQILGYCWSPDGKQLAYTWRQVHPGVPLAENTDNMNDAKLNTETESHLIVADADGRNARTVMSAKSNRATTITIGSVDWK
jgi:RNA polymerase sigma factor (sigma-70 family)